MQGQAQGDSGHLTGGRVSDSPEGVAKARQAKQLLKNGDWAGASAIYRQLTQEFPEDGELRRHFMLNAFRRGDYQEVIQQSLDMADMALAEGNPGAAFERFSEILRLPELVAGERGQEAGQKVLELVEPFKADIYFSYGDHYLAEQNPEMAKQYFEVSDRLSPGRWETHWGIGQAYLMMGDKELAVKSLYDSVNSAPGEAAHAYELLGEVMRGEGHPLEELREMFWRASIIFEEYQLYEEALRVALRWLQLDNQDREMADRTRQLNRMLDDRN